MNATTLPRSKFKTSKNSNIISPLPEFSSTFIDFWNKSQYPTVYSEGKNCSCDCMRQQGTYKKENQDQGFFLNYEMLFDYDEHIDLGQFFNRPIWMNEAYVAPFHV